MGLDFKVFVVNNAESGYPVAAEMLPGVENSAASFNKRGSAA